MIVTLNSFATEVCGSVKYFKITNLSGGQPDSIEYGDNVAGIHVLLKFNQDLYGAINTAITNKNALLCVKTKLLDGGMAADEVRLTLK